MRLSQKTPNFNAQSQCNSTSTKAPQTINHQGEKTSLIYSSSLPGARYSQIRSGGGIPNHLAYSLSASE
jgi:hypothetical protein